MKSFADTSGRLSQDREKEMSVSRVIAWRLRRDAGGPPRCGGPTVRGVERRVEQRPRVGRLQREGRRGGGQLSIVQVFAGGLVEAAGRGVVADALQSLCQH